MSGDDRASTPPGDAPRERDNIFERIVKRSIGSSIGAISRSEESVRALIDHLKLPKDVASVVLDQVDETKKGLYQVVAKEIRDFLQTTNFAGDVKKILTGLAFEVKMEVRFKSVDDDGKAALRPDVKADAALKPTRRRARDEARARAADPPAPDPAPTPDPPPEE